jgi:hypothetical protein
MNRDYTLFWRKIWSHPVLSKTGKKFSLLQAWLYIISNTRKADSKARQSLLVSAVLKKAPVRTHELGNFEQDSISPQRTLRVIRHCSGHWILMSNAKIIQNFGVCFTYTNHYYGKPLPDKMPAGGLAPEYWLFRPAAQPHHLTSATGNTLIQNSLSDFKPRAPIRNHWLPFCTVMIAVH